MSEIQPDSREEPPINTPAGYVAGIVVAGVAALSVLAALKGPEGIQEVIERYQELVSQLQQ